MIFSAKFDRRKVNLLIYVSFWWQACLPTLLYGSELFTHTKFIRETREVSTMVYQEHILCTKVYTEATSPKAVGTELY